MPKYQSKYLQILIQKINTMFTFKRLFLVDGMWGQWSDFSSCSSSCGSGLKRRSRSCLGPFYSGRDCFGETFEELQCQNGLCSGFFKFLSFFMSFSMLSINQTFLFFLSSFLFSPFYSLAEFLFIYRQRSNFFELLSV